MILSTSDPTTVESFRYPGGEWQVRLTPRAFERLSTTKNQVILYERVCSADDLVKARLLESAICGVIKDPFTVILPYYPYGRADRRFTPGDCAGFENMINMFFQKSLTLDIHNPKVFWGHNISPQTFQEQAILDFAAAMNTRDINVLWPDEGAALRYKLPSYVGNNQNAVSVTYLNCTKKRDPQNGKLLNFKVPSLKRPTLIIDDICDGGGTFLGIGAATDQQDMGLFVTHGIFSKGREALGKRFRRVYCTNSFNDQVPFEFFTVYDCKAYLIQKAYERTKSKC